MHGSGQWVSFVLWHTGATLVTHPKAGSLDPAEVWSLVERESISYLAVVGDAFVVPLVDELARHRYDLSSLSVVLTGGAPLSCRSKEGLLAHLPTVLIVDGLGASEAGGQLTHVSTAAGVTTGIFPPSMGNEVLSADLTHALERGDDEIGWLAKSGRLALGYLGDPERTARTYPTIDGTRYAVPGDRARVRRDGQIEVHGRDSMTINSGGEKVFAEEVEAALMAHRDVYDCVVAGRPSRRWGQEVIAVVRLRAGATATADDLVAEASQHVARFKLPKAVVFVDEVVRTPAGKADYRWARQLVASR
jgi:fatty-acyl-CoA synthase